MHCSHSEQLNQGVGNASSMNSLTLEFRLVGKTLEQPLARFFHALRKAGDDRHFHPHPLTDDEAKRRAEYSGKDLYYVLVEGDTVFGYGMLRGWDEGYEVPSLGIVIHPSVRGTGLGELFMLFLHIVARRRGANKVRLKVHPDNTAAVALYRKLGYTFQTEEAEQLVGFLDLSLNVSITGDKREMDSQDEHRQTVIQQGDSE